MRQALSSFFVLATLVFGSVGASCGGKVVVDSAGTGGSAFKNEGGGGSASSSPDVVSSAASSSSDAASSTSSLSSSSSSGGGGAPPIPPLVELDLGTVPIGTTLSFDVPAGVLGVTAFAKTSNSFDEVGFPSLVAPDGSAMISNYGMPQTLADFENWGIAALLVPQTDAPEEMPVAPGTWQLTVGDGGSGTPNAHVSVWMRQTLDGAFHGGVIDVNVFAAPNLATDDYYKYVLEQSFADYAGVNLGTIHILPLDAEYAIIDDSNFYQALEQTIVASGKPALNVLAVSYLTGSLEGAAGVTPGAPSMTLANGTHESGIFWMVFGDIGIDQMVVMHETGHMAGLFHTSELQPGMGDALGDTPLCADASQLDACPDYDNLMFPTGGNGQLALSAMQRQVIDASALYRGIVRPGGAPALPLDGSSASDGSQNAVIAQGAPVTSLAAALAAPWAKRLPPSAARWLLGVGCGRGTVPGAADFATTLFTLGGRDGAALVAIGADPTAPAHVRQRALSAAGRTGLTEEQLDTVYAIATSRAPRPVRLGALHGIDVGSPARGAALRTTLATDADAIVATASRRPP